MYKMTTPIEVEKYNQYATRFCKRHNMNDGMDNVPSCIMNYTNSATILFHYIMFAGFQFDNMYIFYMGMKGRNKKRSGNI